MSKVSWKLFSKINLLSSKKALLHTATMIHCKAGEFLRFLLSTTQENDLEVTFLAGATKVNLKNLET